MSAKVEFYREYYSLFREWAVGLSDQIRDEAAMSQSEDDRIICIVGEYLADQAKKVGADDDVVRLFVTAHEGRLFVSGTVTTEALLKHLVASAKEFEEKTWSRIKSIDLSGVLVEPHVVVEENGVPVFKEGPMPGTDEAIALEGRIRIGPVEVYALPGESISLEFSAVKGVLRIVGKTNSPMLYRRTRELAERAMPHIEGLKSIDTSGLKVS